MEYLQINTVIQNNTPTTQTQYDIHLTLGHSNGDEISGWVSFKDSGNNAEYESQIDTCGNKFMSNSFNEYQYEIIHECLDMNQGELYQGNTFQLVTYDLISKQYLAFCPIHMSQEEALNVAKDYLKAGHVAVVSKGYGSEQHNVKVVPFRGNVANSYGYDLYLYETDGNDNKYLSCGDFK